MINKFNGFKYPGGVRRELFPAESKALADFPACNFQREQIARAFLFLCVQLRGLLSYRTEGRSLVILSFYMKDLTLLLVYFLPAKRKEMIEKKMIMK